MIRHSDILHGIVRRFFYAAMPLSQAAPLIALLRRDAALPSGTGFDPAKRHSFDIPSPLPREDL